MSTAVEEEIATMTAHANALASIPVVYPDDHVPDPDEVELPRKMTAFPVDLPAPPKVVATSDDSTTSGGTLTLNIKSLKPPISFTLSNVNATDTILNIKERLASEHTRAPVVDAQRLLLKGKVLADNKLLKEYLSLPSSGTEEINLSLMIKQGVAWSAEEKKPPPAATTTAAASNTNVISPKPQHPHPHLETGSLSSSNAHPRGHSRTPSEGGAADQYPVPALMLSTPGSPTSEKERAPVPIDIADSQIQSITSRPGSPSSPGGAAGGLSHILTRPEFWVHLHEFLRGEVLRSMQHDESGGGGFNGSGPHATRLEADANELFESFLLASKGSLEATDIARIRDAVNITGMAGT